MKGGESGGKFNPETSNVMFSGFFVCILRQVAENMHDSKLMSRYVEELSKKDREKWQ